MRPLLMLCFALTACMLTGCQTADIDGTYVLVRRELPSGTTIYPPNIVGRLTMEEGQRNFNLYEGYVEGAPVSMAIISNYEFSKEEYRETNIYSLLAGPDGVERDMSTVIGASPVTREGGAIKFKMPLRDEPMVEFTGNGLTATRVNEFVDYWEKID